MGSIACGLFCNRSAWLIPASSRVMCTSHFSHKLTHAGWQSKASAASYSLPKISKNSLRVKCHIMVQASRLPGEKGQEDSLPWELGPGSLKAHHQSPHKYRMYSHIGHCRVETCNYRQSMRWHVGGLLVFELAYSNIQALQVHFSTCCTW